MTRRVKIAFWAILVLMVMNCSAVFASSLTVEDVNQILTGINETETSVDSNAQNGILTNSANYEYAMVTKGTTNTQITIYWSNTKPEATLSSSYVQFYCGSGYSMEIYSDGEMRNNRTSTGVYFRLDSDSKYVFLADGATNNTGNGETYGAGWQNKEFVVLYQAPYFEFAKTPIGTTNFTGIGKVNMYYKNTFDNYVNIQGTFKTIGYLYIDKNYNFANIFYPVFYMTKQDFNLQNQWNYKVYDFLQAGEVGKYMKYYVNINTDLLTVPYLYNLYLESVDSSLSTSFNINFGLVSSETTGGIIIESGDTQISGDFTKDNTTLGDINNTIGEIGDKIDNLGNTIENTILGEENESGDRQGGLLGGIIDGLASLFIPSEDFFSSYFTELNDWFSARLGLLYFPFELIFDFIDRVLTIDFSEPRLEIGPYTFPQFDNVEIVPKLEFNFNNYLENETFKWAHDTYLIIMDALIVFGLVGLIRQKYEEVMTK